MRLHGSKQIDNYIPVLWYFVIYYQYLFLIGTTEQMVDTFKLKLQEEKNTFNTESKHFLPHVFPFIAVCHIEVIQVNTTGALFCPCRSSQSRVTQLELHCL